MTEPVTRGEFTMLERQVEENARRLNTIDASGTRGVGVLQLQITDLAREFAKHEEKHAQDETRRVAARRWGWTFVAAGAASMAAVITLLVDIASHLH